MHLRLSNLETDDGEVVLESALEHDRSKLVQKVLRSGIGEHGEVCYLSAELGSVQVRQQLARFRS